MSIENRQYGGGNRCSGYFLTDSGRKLPFPRSNAVRDKYGLSTAKIHKLEKAMLEEFRTYVALEYT